MDLPNGEDHLLTTPDARRVEIEAQRSMTAALAKESASSPQDLERTVLAIIQSVEFAHRPDTARDGRQVAQEEWSRFLQGLGYQDPDLPRWQTVRGISPDERAQREQLVADLLAFWQSRVLFWALYCRPSRHHHESKR